MTAQRAMEPIYMPAGVYVVPHNLLLDTSWEFIVRAAIVANNEVLGVDHDVVGEPVQAHAPDGHAPTVPTQKFYIFIQCRGAPRTT